MGPLLKAVEGRDLVFRPGRVNAGGLWGRYLGPLTYHLRADPAVEDVAVVRAEDAKYAPREYLEPIAAGLRDAQADGELRLCCVRIEVVFLTEHPVDTTVEGIRLRCRQEFAPHLGRERRSPEQRALVPVPPPDPTWLTPAVRELMEAAHAGGALDLMPVLADALEEAGCDRRLVLDHCRAATRHGPDGCWVVEWVRRMMKGEPGA